MRKFFQRLSGDQLSKYAFWKELDLHNKRRNGIVHRGRSCTDEEAGASIQAVEAYIKHMERWLA